MRILYLYNKKDWAVHNVGKIWLKDQPLDNLEIEFRDYHDIENSKKEFGEFDYVWFCLYIYEKFEYDPDKSIVTLHDPLELFSQDKYWKQRPIPKDKLAVLRKLKNLNVISKELKSLLADHNINAYVIPTTISMPVVDPSSLQKPKKCKLLTVTNEYPRKNLKLMQEIKKRQTRQEFRFV